MNSAFVEKRLAMIVGLVAVVTALAETGDVQAQCTNGCTAIHTWDAGVNMGSYGWAVSEMRDLDGDGAMDAIIGAPFNAVGGAGAGRAIVRSTGPAGTTLHTFTGNPGDNMGYAIADAGFVDADAMPDIIVGAPSQAGGGPGRVVIYSGATGAVIHDVPGEANNDRFGYAVAGIGDVNNDGRDDVLVGAPLHDTAGAQSGRAYVVSGMDGTVIGSPIDGEGAIDQFGTATSGLGDVNGDNVPDFVVGAKNAGATVGAGPGRAYIYDGATRALLFAVNPSAGGSAFGDFFVGGPGDVNNDGTPDVYVGDYNANAGAGRAYVFSGDPNDLGAIIHEFPGGAGEGFGPGRGALDVDNDGYADIAVGGYTSNAGTAGGGRVNIYSGQTGGLLRTYLNATGGEQLGFDVIGVGDVDGDGLYDFLASGPPANRVYVLAGDVPRAIDGDFDGDGDVDLGDFANFSLCFGGANLPPAGSCPMGVDADFDDDGDVDLGDFATFSLNFTGSL